MAKSNTRTLSSEKMSGISNIPANTYNDQAGAIKQLGPIVGKLIYVGSVSTEREFDTGGKIIAFYNNSGSTLWVLTGAKASDLTALTPSASNAIALRPNDYTHIALGTDRAVKASSANALAYIVEDDSFID